MKFAHTLALGVILSTATLSVNAQISFTNGENAMELSGTLAAFYNYRILNSSLATTHIGNNPLNPLDQKKNTFTLNTARINFQGMYTRKFEYRVQVDVAQLGYLATTGEYPAIVDAYMVYKPLRGMRITAGYQKLPYSANSLASLQTQPYWQRAEITRGYIFSRRDVGITVKQSFFNERINIYGGMYSGMGEYILTSVTGGDNDNSGTPEYVGRLELSTQKYNYNDIFDTKHFNTPVVNVGLNARYVKRNQSLDDIVGTGTGASLPDYDLKILAGKKTTLGMDVAVAYKGFSAQFEIHQLIIQPTAGDTTRLQGKNTTYFKAGGLFGELNYYNKKYKSGLFVRYDNFIPNDLIAGNMEQTISFGYNFFMKGQKSVLKVQYFSRLDKNNAALLRTSDQVRLGWLFAF